MVNILLSIFSGALLSAAFAPIAIWWLAPLAITLHMYILNRCARPFLNSFIFALSFNAIALHWTGIYVGATPWIMLAVGQAVLFIPLGLVKRYSTAIYPLIFLILEEIRGRFPFGGFGWLRLAYSQADAPYRAIAAVGGAAGLSAVVLCISFALFSLLHSRFTLIPVLPLLLLLIPVQTHTVGSIKTLLIQGDVPRLGLDFNSRAKQVFFNHIKESERALKENSDVDFILWPENAVDVDPFTNKDVSQSLDSLAKPLIIGAVMRDKGRLQNVSILWNKTSRTLYVKQHLTPFGEYIPMRSLATKISPLSASIEDFSPGNNSQIFTINGAKIAAIICFELVDDEITERAAKGSNLLVVQTNSATFGKSAQSAQQLAITRIRAIEHGRNILSVSTTGITATIDFKGDILQRAQLHRAAHIFADTALIEGATLRDRIGDWALYVALIWLFLLSRRYSQMGK